MPELIDGDGSHFPRGFGLDQNFRDGSCWIKADFKKFKF
jgi:hypothetical protein